MSQASWRPNPDRRRDARSSTFSPSTLAGILLAAVVVVGAVVSGTVESSDVALVVMGFDPDRAQLITALVVGAVVAAMAALAAPRTRFATLLGIAGVAALYLQTFVAETQNALAATGALGSFSPGGWIVTLATLAVIGTLAAAAGATLAVALRPALIATGSDLGLLLGGGRDRVASLRRPIVAVLVLILLVVTVPAFGDMVNLSPDALMLGGVERIPLSGGAPSSAASRPSDGGGGATATTGPTVGSTTDPSAGPTTGSTSTPGSATAPGSSAGGSRPWLAWRPSGAGRVVNYDVPAPWTGGTRTVADFSVYTPPGYDPAGSRSYPVLYEAPTGFTLWDKGTGATAALDSLIDSGAMPASIVVFIDEWGAPFPDSECANSTNGQMKMETFISKTVPEYVDSHYRTIARPAGRGIMGMSAGGFCAAMLALRHPDVFGTSISFSGYYEAGSANSNSARPFVTPAALAAYSPARLISTLAPQVRVSLYLVVVADPSQPFYGPEAANFEQLLKADGYRYKAIDSAYTHGWPQVRNEFPAVAADWGARLVANRAF